MEPDFFSFKNSLLSWCKKQKNHEISISNQRRNDGVFESNINFLSKSYTSRKWKTIKEAEQDVCCQMLIDLCLLPSSYSFDIKDCFFVPQYGDSDFISFENCLLDLSNHSSNFKPTFSITKNDDISNPLMTACLKVDSFKFYLETNNPNSEQIKEKLARKAMEVLGLLTGTLDSSVETIVLNDQHVKIIDSLYEETYEIKYAHGHCLSCNIQCELKDNLTDELSSEIHHKIHWEKKNNSNDEYLQLMNDIENLQMDCSSETHKFSFSDNQSISKDLTSLSSSKLSLDSTTEFGMKQKRFLDRLKKLDETIINYENNFKP